MIDEELKKKFSDTASKLNDFIDEVDPVHISEEYITDDVRPKICGGWLHDATGLDVYIFHRCDFYEVRITKYRRHWWQPRKKELGYYLLIGYPSAYDSHLCYFHDGKKEIVIGYNERLDEIVLSPLGLTLSRSTIKAIDNFNETRKMDPNQREMYMDMEDQIFKKGYVDCANSELIDILKKVQ